MKRIIRAPRGAQLNTKGWQQEAALRMLMNNLDPDVAENPDELVVYGGTGKAARNWACYDKIVSSLKELESDETLLVQSGKPVAIFKTHLDAPRVLIANSLLVPHWANWDKFRELDKLGLIMYGQMTAGSWIYIGTQGILQGTYETFASCADKHFGGNLKGKLILSGGLGGMGGAQPLAATMNSACFIGVEVDPERIKKRIQTKYLDKMTDNFQDAINLVNSARDKGESISVGLLGNASDIFPLFVKNGIIPDIVTDQTSAHDTLNGYIPSGYNIEQASLLRKDNPKKYVEATLASIAIHVRAMIELQKMGSIVFDYGNNIRTQAKLAGVDNAFDFQGFIPLYIRPLFCEGKGPFRWVALSGEKDDIYATDSALKEIFPDDNKLIKWLNLAQERVKFQGLPARICWLGYGDRLKAGLAFNKLVSDKKVKAPIVIGRDHLDCGSVASPYRETESMKDGSDAIADWPILNALINAVNGATWVSVHHGGGVGIGYSIHAGQVIVADGTMEAEKRLTRVLTSDPGMGVARHVDAGYDRAIEVAIKNGIKIPSLKKD